VTLIGRDVDSGKPRWRTPLGPVGNVTVKPAGQALLAEDGKGAVHALDLRTGRQRGTTPPAADGTFAEIADARTVAMLRCARASASDVRSGRVVWRRPTDGAMPVRTADLSSRLMAVIGGACCSSGDSYASPRGPPPRACRSCASGATRTRWTTP
jgi:outer membrane protein assembly factor BamB